MSVWGQVSFENLSLNDPEQNQFCKGVVNLIYIVGTKNDTTLILKSANDGVLISKKGNTKFELSVNSIPSGSTIQLDLYQQGKYLLTESFDVKHIGDPIARLGILTDSLATIEQIVSNPKLSVVTPGCCYNSGFKITSFQLEVIRSGITKQFLKSIEVDTIHSENIETGELEITIEKKEPYTKSQTSGDKLTETQLRFIKTLSEGDKVIISQIMVVNPGSSIRQLKELIITIK